MSIVWSKYQTDIFWAAEELQESLLIEAVAGSGKSTVLEECLFRLWAKNPLLKIIFVAFGKPIAEAMNARLKRRGVPELASTLHSVGWQAWRNSLSWDSNLCKVEQNKVFTIMKEMMSWKERERWGETTRRMVGLGKQHGIVPNAEGHVRGVDINITGLVGLAPDSDEQWESLADHYGVDWDEVSMKWVRRMLARSIELSREQCDFDDMLMMPVVAGVEFDKWDVVFVDEAQDLSSIQIEMVSRMVRT